MEDNNQQDANQNLEQESSEPVVSENSEVATQNNGEAVEAKPEPAQPRFDEHPRFKELIAERNQFKQELAQYRQELAAFKQQQAEQARQQQRTNNQDPFISKIRGIDKDLADRLESYDLTRQELEDLRSWRQEQETAQILDRFDREVMALAEKHKVPDYLRTTYKQEIENLAKADPSLDFKDMERLFSDVHAKWNNTIENIRREERSKYGSQKKADAVKPSAASKPVEVKKGGKPNEAPIFDREEMLARVANKAASSYRAETDS